MRTIQWTLTIAVLASALQCSSSKDEPMWWLLLALQQSAAAEQGSGDGGSVTAPPVPPAGDPCEEAGGIGYTLYGECAQPGYVLNASRDRRSGVTVSTNCANPQGQLCVDGIAFFNTVSFTMPAEFAVAAEGAPGNHSADFTYDSTVCVYGGNGPNSSGGTAYVSSIVGGVVGAFSDGTQKLKGYCYTLDTSSGAVLASQTIPVGQQISAQSLGLRVSNSAGGKLSSIQFGDYQLSSGLGAYLGAAGARPTVLLALAAVAVAALAIIAMLKRRQAA